MAEEFVLPQTMTSLTLKKKEDVYEVFARAIELRTTTPHSFQYFIINEKIFSPITDSKELEALLLRIEKLPALPLTMSELLFYCFPGKIQCCNPFCKNGLSIKNPSSVLGATKINRIEDSPITGSTGINNSSFGSTKTIDKPTSSVKFAIKDTGSRKNIVSSESYKMNLLPNKDLPPLGSNIDSKHDSKVSKTFDLSSRADSDADFYCEKCNRRRRLEEKKNNNIPLTESEKRELNFVKMEMMIFDVRYEELQEHGTLPNCLRFSLKERLTEEDVNKFIEDYS